MMVEMLNEKVGVPAWQRAWFESPPTLERIRQAMFESERLRERERVIVFARGDHPQLEALNTIQRETSGRVHICVLPVKGPAPEPPEVWVHDAIRHERLVAEMLRPMRFVPAPEAMRGPRPIAVIIDEIKEQIEKDHEAKVRERPTRFIDTSTAF